MGDTVSREVMSNFVHNNNSIVYNKSETEYDFKNYFREQASLHNINLSNETNYETFNEIISLNLLSYFKFLILNILLLFVYFQFENLFFLALIL